MVFLFVEVYRALYFHLTDRFLLLYVCPIDRVVLQIPYTSYECDGVINDKISVLSSTQTPI